MNPTRDKLKLAIARSHHVMSALGDTSILVTGGFSPDEEVLDTAEVLDLEAQESHLLKSHHLPRAGHSCVKLKNGRILLIGGSNEKHVPESRVEAFDPAARSFTVIGQLVSARVLQQAVLLPDGQVFVCGGMDAGGTALDSAELFDPVTSKASALPVMLHKRYSHQAVLLEGGLVLITGGAGDAESRRSAEIFDVAKRVFLPPVALQEDRVIHTATLLADGRAFVFSNGVGEVFSSKANQFVRVPGNAAPPIRDGHTATLFKGGDVLIVGGGLPEDEEDILGAPVLFRPVADSYLELKASSELVDRSDHAAIAMSHGDVLITGGRTVHATATDDIVTYDSAKRQFR
jgi:hypothetical protein